MRIHAVEGHVFVVVSDELSKLWMISSIETGRFLGTTDWCEASRMRTTPYIITDDHKFRFPF